MLVENDRGMVPVVRGDDLFDTPSDAIDTPEPDGPVVRANPIVPGFQVLELAGSGGLGDVFVAKRLSTGGLRTDDGTILAAFPLTSVDQFQRIKWVLRSPETEWSPLLLQARSSGSLADDDLTMLLVTTQ